ncbi:hypothetical protein ArsFIN_47110 (plasmid) [Arsenophonus nasoniae]|uniref:Transposase IS801/IS1294 domain-containing protein n=1 Tax=Arsenophonus nasoniae TaxID=638 RepID=A0A4P7L4Z3_9GAMM|nr:hypothetical protein ArsFIN_47110 [Arsenophonus nasoniae]
MIRRYISHIPARHFKMVRYSGFLSNRKRGKLLPKVYKALEMTARKKPENPGFFCADERISAYRSVQMYSVWRQAAFHRGANG